MALMSTWWFFPINVWKKVRGALLTLFKMGSHPQMDVKTQGWWIMMNPNAAQKKNESEKFFDEDILILYLCRNNMCICAYFFDYIPVLCNCCSYCHVQWHVEELWIHFDGSQEQLVHVVANWVVIFTWRPATFAKCAVLIAFSTPQNKDTGKTLIFMLEILTGYVR